MATNDKNHTPSDGRNAEDRAYERFRNMMIEKLETIRNNPMQPWFEEGSVRWTRTLSGNGYNGMNALMLIMHCEKEGYKTPVFMTFDQVASLNFDKSKERKPLRDEEGHPLPRVSILKGSKSFPVFLATHTVVHNKTNEKINYSDYKKLLPDKQDEYKVDQEYQVFNVFNIAQTNIVESRPELYAKLHKDNKELPPELIPDAYSFPAMDKIINENDWQCPIYIRHQDKSFFSRNQDEIILQDKSQFDSNEVFYGTALQEMVNSIGSKDTSEGLSDPSYALIAELSSSLVMQKYGLSKTIKKDSQEHIEEWLSELRENNDFIKNLLTDIRKTANLINAKIDTINCQLVEESLGSHNATLPVTAMPAEVVSEFHMVDNESRDEIYKLLYNNFSCHDGVPIKISRPKDKVVRLGTDHCDKALDCVYNNMDSETLGKIVSLKCYLKGHPIERYDEFMNRKFTLNFETKRTDPTWVKSQGLEGNIQWDIRFISDDGYHLVKAISGKQCKLGALDHNADTFLPFVEIGKEINIETDLGYMTELRRRLLSKDEKVDSLGRIKFAGPPTQNVDTGVVTRPLLIDGDAKATFILEPDDNIYTLNFLLELGKTNTEEYYSECMPSTIKYNKDKGVYESAINNIWNLFIEKDRLYPIRIIDDKTNMYLADYLLQEQTKNHEKEEMEGIKEKIEVHPGLYAFQSKEDLWGLMDEKERTVIHPRWISFKQKDNGDILFGSLKLRTNEIIHQVNLTQTSKELAETAAQLSRLSDVSIDVRGIGTDRWISANIDGKPVVSEKISERDWVEQFSGVVSPLKLGMQYFANYLTNTQQEELRSGKHI